MGGLSGLLGTAGGASGSGFAAPQGTNPQQTNQAYTNTQQGITNQQNFVNQLQGTQGLANQQAVFGQQQALAGQLQGVANGTGPNPALAQLNQATGANVANQAALMAGQRGSTANAGLIARQAAQQGAATQQQAVGQGATLQAQQQLAAMQQLQNQQTSMANLAGNQVNQQQAGNTAFNNAALGQQSNLLNIQGNQNTNNANLAGTSQSGQSNMLGSLTGALGSAGSLFGGSSASTGLNSDGSISAVGSGTDLAGGATDAGSGLGDLTTMVAASGGQVPQPQLSPSTASRSAMMANGGDPLMESVPNQIVQATPTQLQSQSDPNAPQSNIGKQLALENVASKTPTPPSQASQMMNQVMSVGKTIGQGVEHFGGQVWNQLSDMGSDAGSFVSDAGEGLGSVGSEVAGGAGDAVTSGEAGTAIGGLGEAAAADTAVAARGGIAKKKVPALVSPGEQYLPPKDVKKVVKDGKNPLKTGERIPGKPKFKGNNYANDIVPKTLESGGIVIPNSVMQSKNPHFAAMKFVHATIAKNRGGLPKKGK